LGDWVLMRGRNILSGAALAALIGQPELASGQTTGLDTLPAVVVNGADGGNANGRPDLAPNNVANFARVAPSSRPHTETFTRQDIEELKPSNVFDLLQHAVGVVVTFQGRKKGYDLMIRGDSNYAYIIDGAYVPVATASRLLQTLPVSAIEQIDVVRDSTALTLGPLVTFDSASGALNSGFIVIRTRQSNKTEAELRGAVESYGTFTASGYAGTAFAGGGNMPKSYFSGLVSQRRTDGPAGYNAWGNATTAMVKAGVTTGILETNFELFQDHTRYGFQQAQPGQNTSALVAQRWSYAPIDSTLLTSNSKLTWDEHSSTLLILSYNSVSAQNVQGSNSSTAVTLVPDQTYTISANVRHNLQFDHTLLQFGGEYVNFNSPTGQMFYAGYAHSEQTFSGYIHGEQGLFEDRVILDASARFDNHDIIQGIDLYNQGNGSGGSTGSGSGSGAGSGTGGGSGSGSGSGSGKSSTTTAATSTTTTTTYQYFYNRSLPLAKNFAGGATFKLIPQLVATARYSHTEQGGITGIISATGQQLDPETQNKWEVGLEAPLWAFFRPGFNVFDTKIDNDKTPTSYTTVNGYQTALWSQTNTERRGFELIGNGQLTSAYGLTSYRASWMHLTDVTSSTIAVYPATIPKNVVNFALTHNWQDYSGTIGLTYVSPFWSNFNSADGLYHSIGNFVTIDMRLGRSFDFGWTKANLSVYGRNITNRKYETVYGFPGWGAVYGSELVLTF